MSSFRVAISCPEHWSGEQVELMADRLIADALPSTVAVMVERVDNDVVTQRTLIREAVSDAD
jgi:hypothetical protein